MDKVSAPGNGPGEADPWVLRLHGMCCRVQVLPCRAGAASQSTWVFAALRQSCVTMGHRVPLLPHIGDLCQGLQLGGELGSPHFLATMPHEHPAATASCSWWGVSDKTPHPQAGWQLWVIVSHSSPRQGVSGNLPGGHRQDNPACWDPGAGLG